MFFCFRQCCLQSVVDSVLHIGIHTVSAQVFINCLETIFIFFLNEKKKSMKVLLKRQYISFMLICWYVQIYFKGNASQKSVDSSEFQWLYLMWNYLFWSYYLCLNITLFMKVTSVWDMSVKYMYDMRVRYMTEIYIWNLGDVFVKYEYYITTIYECD